MSIHNDKTRLRQHLRQQRRSLTNSERRDAEQHILKHIISHFGSLLGPACAAYFGTQEEVNLQGLFEHCWDKQLAIYSPLVQAADTPMHFQQIKATTPLIENRYGIKEPETNQEQQLAPNQLSIVFTPLVGFDPSGARLGMGGGFYDRCFSFKRHQNTKPWLVGCAYELQKLPELEKESWDIDLDAIVTESQVYWVNPNLRRAAFEM